MGELLLSKTKLEYRSTLSKEATKLDCGLFLLLSCSKKEPEQLHVRLCHKPRRMKPLLVVFFSPTHLAFFFCLLHCAVWSQRKVWSYSFIRMTYRFMNCCVLARGNIVSLQVLDLNQDIQAPSLLIKRRVFGADTI